MSQSDAIQVEAIHPARCTCMDCFIAFAVPLDRADATHFEKLLKGVLLWDFNGDLTVTANGHERVIARGYRLAEWDAYEPVETFVRVESPDMPRVMYVPGDRFTRTTR